MKTILKEKRTDERIIIDNILSDNTSSLESIDEHARTEAVCWAALLKDDNNIRHIINQTEQMQLYYISSQYYFDYLSLINPSNAVQKAAVMKAPFNIVKVRYQDRDMAKRVAEGYPLYFSKIYTELVDDELLKIAIRAASSSIMESNSIVTCYKFPDNIIYELATEGTDVSLYSYSYLQTFS